MKKIAFFLIVIFAISGGNVTHSFAAEVDLHYAELREALFSECEQAKGTVEALEYIAKDSKAESLNALESVFYEFAALLSSVEEDSEAQTLFETYLQKISVIEAKAIEEDAEARAIFDDRISAFLEEMKKAYAEIREHAEQYSKKSLEELEAVYQAAIGRLSSAEIALGEMELLEIVENAILDMRAVKMEWISTGNISIKSSGVVEYPAGYDYSVDGVWGVVKSDSGVPIDVKLKITVGGDKKRYKSALKRALDESRVACVGEIPMTDKEIRQQLKNLEIKEIFTIKLIQDGALYNELSGSYTVRILLPQYMLSERNLRVVYISSDGSAEYYDAKREGGMLVFDTEHFSDFVVLGERQNNFFAIGMIFFGLFLALALIVGVGTLRRRTRAYAAAERAHVESGGARSFLPYGEYNSAMLPLYLERVSAEEADSFISDGRAAELLRLSERSVEICRGCRKTCINVDTLSENFERGECVSIKTLKERGLIPPSACYLKVLGRGIIDKPLVVRAQEFSANAIKMITLTGGDAILEGNEEKA